MQGLCGPSDRRRNLQNDRHPVASVRRTADRSASSCGSARMARRRPSTRFCSASSLSPSSSLSSSSGTSSASCSRMLLERPERTRRTVSRIRSSEALTAPAESVRRPGYPLDRAGAYVFLERALELPHSGEGRRSRKQRKSPIAHETARAHQRPHQFPLPPYPRERAGDGRVRPHSLPAPASRRGDHPVRHRAELLARHAAHRKPGRALGGRQQLAARLSPKSASCASPNTLQQTLQRQMLAAGLQNNPTTSVQGLLLPNATFGTGDPVRIQIRSRFDVLPILGVGSLSLKAKATMRLEHTQDPLKGGLITGAVACT